MRTIVVAAIVCGAHTASAATLQVGTGKPYTTLAAAAAAAVDGDVVEIGAGTFHEAVTWSRDNLTIRGVGGRPVIDMTGMPIANGKALFVTAGANIEIENLEFKGAAVPDANGAGIRWEGAGSLTVRNCVFRDNENGILGGGGAHPENTALIEYSEFVGNGRGDVGYTHSVYIGTADRVTFRGNWSHALYGAGDDVGHLFKSRAKHTFVLYNRLTSEGTQSSYEINIPQGGEAYVIGNLIQQREGGQRVMLSYGDGDGTQYPGGKLYVVNNTFVNESAGDAAFVVTKQADAQVTVVNNLLVGPGTLTRGGIVTAMNNVSTTTPGFVDQPNFDYHLLASSPAVDTGVGPGTAGAMSLVPTEQYVHPMAVEGRGAAGGSIDVGAYEYGNQAPGDASVGNGPDASVGNDPDVTNGNDPDVTNGTTPPGGCGCTEAGEAYEVEGSASLLSAGVVALLLWRRRRRESGVIAPERSSVG